MVSAKKRASLLLRRSSIPRAIDLQIDLLSKLVYELLVEDSPRTIEEDLVEIAALLDDDGGDSLSTDSLDAPSTIVECMKKWQHDADIQEWSLWCLHKMACSREDVRSSIMDCGGVEAMVSAMKLYPNVADIQRGGFLALASVLTSPDTSLAQFRC